MSPALPLAKCSLLEAPVYWGYADLVTGPHTLKKISTSEPLWHRLHNKEAKTAWSWILVCLRSSELLVIHVSIKRCASKEGVRRGRLDCTTLGKKHELLWQQTQTFITTFWNWLDKDTASRVFAERYWEYEVNLLYFSFKIAVKTRSCTLALLFNKKKRDNIFTRTVSWVFLWNNPSASAW